MPKSFDKLDPHDFIIIKGARVHNLKNVDVAIPRNELVVITGISGSGKSSLAFDTLFAEGQRRYVESLSAYARQFLDRMDKPEVDYIKGLSPSIAIEQKVNSSNPRSTVGTSTEIYDYLKLLYARIGKTFSPVSGNQVKRHSVTDVVDELSKLEKDSKVYLLTKLDNKNLTEQLKVLIQQGFTRIYLKGEIHRIDDLLEKGLNTKDAKSTFLLIDRFIANSADEDLINRMADSVQTAFYEGLGECQVEAISPSGKKSEFIFSNKFELDELVFEEPSVNFFSFNNPYGACDNCEGFGSIIGIDEDLVIPDKGLSVFEDAVACWKGEKAKNYKNKLIAHAEESNFPLHRPYYDLTKEEKDLLWKGNKLFKGIHSFFAYIEQKQYKIQNRVMLSRYRGKTTCPECRGTRLRGDADYVKVGEKSIIDLTLLPIEQLSVHFEKLKLSKHDQEVAKRLLKEINNRLQFLNDVGLGYLTLNRQSSTLSGGESQRINLATSLGSSLVGSTYILDEPSIGLHPRDTQRLLKVLKGLRDVGNTVVVVEHDEEIMLASDTIIDMGPLAGTHGGSLIFSGDHKALLNSDSLTAKYLTGKLNIDLPKKRRTWKKSITIKGANENNLKSVDAEFPLGIMTAVTGVSGSGKTSLVKQVFYPAVKKITGGYEKISGSFDKIEGDYKSVKNVEFIDQNPIGKSSRSNPVTYVKAYDEIRSIFATQPLSKNRAYKPSHFSFNVAGGRCDVCEGEGTVKIEMQFMADIVLPCEECHGKRFKEETLDVLFKGKSIYDVLCLTIEEAIEFFGDTNSPTSSEKKLLTKLQPLADVGLGYVQLGQASSTLSGGEAQRIKLASFLTKGKTQDKTLFIFDEPTTGLHFHDIHKLLYAFNALLEQGHTIIVIEHNQEVIKCADWVIDIGPEGGDKGGEIVFEGVPEDLIKNKKGWTGKYLKSKLN